MSIKPKIKSRPDFFSLDKTHPLAKGLVFAGLGRGRGSLQLRDSSPYGNHGTLTNMEPGSGWVFDPYLGRWVTEYDGNDDYVNVLNSGSINSACGVGQPRSVSAWLKFTSVSNLVILEKGNNAQFVFQIYLGKARFRVGGEGVSDALSVVVNDGRQHHIAAGYDGVNAWISTDGVGGSSLPNTASAVNTSNLVIGSRAGSYGFVGSLADVMIYNRSLLLSEIQQLADPSNVLLSGLIKPPRRRLWTVGTIVTPPAAGNRRRRVLIAGVSR